MLGSAGDADDALQEAWLRIHEQDPAGIENVQAWLTTVVGRVCLNVLRSRRHDEASREVHVPDPVVVLGGTPDPGQEALVADSVGLALQVVLDSLNPAERLALVLHDVFGVPFAEIARVLDRSEAAAQQGVLRRQPSLVLRGAGAVAAHTATYSKWYPLVRPALVNGAAGAVVATAETVLAVMAFTVTSGKIVRIDVLRDPDRLDRLALAI
jgi:RNA polymerase sigma factor (sigma-70 family)